MLRGYLGRKGIKGVIRVRRDRVGREDVEGGEYKERDEIEGLFGNLKMKLSGYVGLSPELCKKEKSDIGGRGNKMNTKPSLKRLSANMIKKLLQLIEERLKQLPSKKRKRGRSKVYSDSFILLIYFIKVLRNYSFRDTVFYLEEILGEAIDFPNLRYCILKSFSKG